MIYAYTGLVGSGKTFHAVHDMLDCPNEPFITNINVDLPNVAVFPTEEITPELVRSFCVSWWKDHPFKEDGITLILDECAIFFNSRTWGDKSRLAFITLLSVSRHYGLRVILISQSLEAIDKQARNLCGYEVRHSSSGYVSAFSGFLSMLGFKLTCAKCFYAETDDLVWRKFLPISKKVYQWYDTNQDIVTGDFVPVDVSEVYARLKMCDSVEEPPLRGDSSDEPHHCT